MTSSPLTPHLPSVIKRVCLPSPIPSSSSSSFKYEDAKSLDAHLLTNTFIVPSSYHPNAIDFEVLSSFLSSCSSSFPPSSSLPSLYRWVKTLLSLDSEFHKEVEKHYKIPFTNDSFDIYSAWGGVNTNTSHPTPSASAAAGGVKETKKEEKAESKGEKKEKEKEKGKEKGEEKNAKFPKDPKDTVAAAAAAADTTGSAKKDKSEKKKEDKNPSSSSSPSSSPSPSPATSTASAVADVSSSQTYRCDFRIGTITSSSAHPTDAACIVLNVNFNEGKDRVIVAGMSKYIGSDVKSIVGNQIIALLNIDKATIKGVESEGRSMVATSADGTKKSFVRPEEKEENGSYVDLDGMDRAKLKRDAAVASKNLHKIFKELCTDDKGNFCAGKFAFKTASGKGVKAEVVAGTVQ